MTKGTAKLLNYGGPERDRTAGLLVANEALSQLSYRPNFRLLPTARGHLQRGAFESKSEEQLAQVVEDATLHNSCPAHCLEQGAHASNEF